MKGSGKIRSLGKENAMSDLNEQLTSLNNTPDISGQIDPEDARKNQFMGVLAYISWLVVIPLFCARDSAFARFHTNQGLVLAITEAVLLFVLRILGKLPLVGWIFRLGVVVVGFCCFILMILGIMNAINLKAKELPVIGSFRILK